MTLFQASLTTEEKTEEFEAGKGVVVKWEPPSSPEPLVRRALQCLYGGGIIAVYACHEEPKQRKPRLTLDQMAKHAADRPTARELAEQSARSR